MGCFIPCFGSRKRRKCQKSRKRTLIDHRGEGVKLLDATEEEEFEKLTQQSEPVQVQKKKLEEFLSSDYKEAKKFDLDIKSCKESSATEVTDDLVEKGVEEDSKEKDLPSVEVAEDLVGENSEKKDDAPQCGEFPLASITSNVVSIESENKELSSDKAAEDLNNEDGEKKEITLTDGELQAQNPSNVVSYYRNHRYGNGSKDDDSTDVAFEESDLDDIGDDTNNGMMVEGESSESLFSLSISSRKQACEAETGEKEVTSPMPKQASSDQEQRTPLANKKAQDRSHHLHSVLNPVENLLQWQSPKSIVTPPLKQQHQDKENINIEQESHASPISPKPSFRISTRDLKYSKVGNQEVGVDTSLSSWLAGTQATPLYKASDDSVKNSPKKYEDRPILGALTVKELKQLSASVSPKTSRSKSPEDMPLIGTVGSYWHHTGQNVDSDSGSSCTNVSNPDRESGERKRANWDSSPFEEKLERALQRA